MLDLIVVVSHRQAVDLTSIDYRPSILSTSTNQVRIDLALLLVSQNLILSDPSFLILLLPT